MDDSRTMNSPDYVGERLPQNQKVLNEWLTDLVTEVDSGPHQPFHPVIQEFQLLIESDPKVYAAVSMMFEQHSVQHEVTDGRQVRDYLHFLKLLNAIIQQSPTFSETGCVGSPINAILDWAMGTTGGFAAFLNDKFNAQLKKVLLQWGAFLESEDSKYVLQTSNAPIEGSEHRIKPKHYWLSDMAMVAMMQTPGEPMTPQEARTKFLSTFKCDEHAPHYGFGSWNDFFTREFKDESVRPVAGIGDDSIIINACESAPYKIRKGDEVKRLNQFWIKGQPYSLQHMLDNDPRVEHFVGGTVYQAFLRATSYHRWHSPVSGMIVGTKNVEGVYYSENPRVITEQESSFTSSPGSRGPNGYITELAPRALVFIQADNPKIGLMGIVLIGMAEVSTCDIHVHEGQRVKKGEFLGTFRYGGSSHCLLFGKDVDLTFTTLESNPAKLGSRDNPVNSELAIVN